MSRKVVVTNNLGRSHIHWLPWPPAHCWTTAHVPSDSLKTCAASPCGWRSLSSASTAPRGEWLLTPRLARRGGLSQPSQHQWRVQDLVLPVAQMCLYSCPCSPTLPRVQLDSGWPRTQREVRGPAFVLGHWNAFLAAEVCKQEHCVGCVTHCCLCQVVGRSQGDSPVRVFLAQFHPQSSWKLFSKVTHQRNFFSSQHWVDLQNNTFSLLIL